VLVVRFLYTFQPMSPPTIASTTHRADNQCCPRNARQLEVSDVQDRRHRSVTSNLHGHRHARRRVVRHLPPGSRRWRRPGRSAGGSGTGRPCNSGGVRPATPALVMPGVYPGPFGLGAGLLMRRIIDLDLDQSRD
jgi:hypothetical protein